MKRLVDWHLRTWKDSKRRKPLLLRGARQVGKTYAVRQFGKSFDSFVELNFEEISQARTLFEQDLDPERILLEIGLLTQTTIVPGRTLLFLDEVQATPRAILALRYFYEKIPELHVIAAGSLLDFAIEQVGVPVGRVSMLYVYPLSFMEFLAAIGHSQLIPAILSMQHFSAAIHNMLLDLLCQYLALGGMPEAVIAFATTKDPRESHMVLKELVEAYRQDFSKYAKKHQIPYLEVLFNQIPHFIGDQFKYSSVHGEYKKRELAPCLDLLRRAQVVHKITHSAGNGIPLGSEVNLEHFKIIMHDVGISQALLGLDLTEWFLNKDKNIVNRGTIVEAFVGQELICYSAPHYKSDLYYWRRESRGAQAEVDYLYDYQSKALPIEVKSGHGSTLRSLHQFLASHSSVNRGIRFWAENYLQMDNLDSLPLYSISTFSHPDQKEALSSLSA
jgi:predicted AAA+ superfamily ATPase